ncbi:MAG: hypothetical protein N2259_00410 [Patescibacteria group bacterium]|nr:hypothetical protein [Patescibacteria group bacterium]
MIDIFLILIASFSFLFCLKIIFSKLLIPVNIEEQKNLKERQRKLKIFILERKIKEKLRKMTFKEFFQKKIENLSKKLIALESKYLKEKSEKILKKRPLALEAEVKSLIEQGEKLLATNNYLEAEKKFLEAASLSPVDVRIFKNLAEIYFIQNKFSLAEKNLKHLLDLTWQSIKWWQRFQRKKEGIPKDLVVELINRLIDLGNFYQKTENEKKSLFYFKKALEFEPNNPKILDFLIENSIILKKKEEAKKYLTKLKEVNPENQKISEWEEKIKNLPT